MERHRERHAKLIEAGFEVISREGYSATSVKSVCTRAGLTERYFYESFENREALLAAIYKHVSEEMKTRILGVLSNAPSAKGGVMRAVANAYFGALKADPRIARILFVESVHLGGTELMKKAGRELVDFIRTTANLYKPDTQLSEERQVLVGSGMFGAFVYIAIRWVEDGFRQPIEDVVESTVLIFEAIGKEVW